MGVYMCVCLYMCIYICICVYNYCSDLFGCYVNVSVYYIERLESWSAMKQA